MKEVHNGMSFHCSKCNDLKEFKIKEDLVKHNKNIHRPDKVCPICRKYIRASNHARHVKKCRSEQNISSIPTDGEDEDMGIDMDDDQTSSLLFDGCVSEDVQSLITPQAMPLPEESRKSKTLAPTKEETAEHFPEFWNWLKNGASVGMTTWSRRSRKRDIEGSDDCDLCNKFRTWVGKMLYLHQSSLKNFAKIMNHKTSCYNFFTNQRIQKISDCLYKGSTTTNQLSSSTAYNVWRPLIKFMEFKVNFLQQKQFESILVVIQAHTHKISKQRKTENYQTEKSNRIASLPQVPEIMDFMDNQLKPLAIRAAKIYETGVQTLADGWACVNAIRDYFLLVLQYDIPPQRLQILLKLNLLDINWDHDCPIFTIEEHKTASIYGAVYVGLRPELATLLRQYISMGQQMLPKKIWYSMKSNGDMPFFFNKLGPEKRITEIYRRIMFAHFGKIITIRDNRNLYITHASKRLKQNEMYELSRKMYHSFQTQQEVYRCDRSIIQALDSFKLAETMRK
jgi:hypothetical protein